VGVAAVALARCGGLAVVPQDYQMRNDDANWVAALLPRFGFMAADGVPQAGDLLVLKPAPARFIWRCALPMAALFMPTPGCAGSSKAPRAPRAN
jgi:hypothetical protein